MKKISWVLALTLMVVSCGKNSSEYKTLKSENDSLKAVYTTQTESFNETLGILNEVEDNFKQLREAENYLTVQNSTVGELSKDQRGRIAENFELVKSLLQKNKEELDKLQQQVKSGKRETIELKRTVARLQEEIETKSTLILSLQEQLGQRDEQIRNLSESLAVLTVNVDSLNKQTKQQAGVLKKQDTELNSAWYMFGTKKELKAHKVLENGKVLQGNFDKNDFIKIDIRKDTQISLHEKKAKLLTSHPEDSYKLVKGSDKNITIEILDYKKFWSTSRFLVVEVD